MQTITDYCHISQIKRCRKESLKNRNRLLQQQTNVFNKIKTVSKYSLFRSFHITFIVK